MERECCKWNAVLGNFEIKRSAPGYLAPVRFVNSDEREEEQKLRVDADMTFFRGSRDAAGYYFRSD